MLEISNAKVEYAGLTGDSWYQVKGIDNSYVQRIISRIKREVNLNGYELWLYGSILEDLPTWDMDISLIGPYNRSLVRNIMLDIVKIGFEERVYIDIKYQFHDKPVDFENYLNNGNKQETYKFAELDDIFISNGNFTEIIGQWDGPLFIREIPLPLDKQIDKYKYNNYIYKRAKQIV